MRVLLYGASGWIGGKLSKLMTAQGWVVIPAKARLEDFAGILAELDTKPDRVVIAAGLTGRPNIDWCEDHKEEVTRVNLFGTYKLVQECWKRKIHTTFFGTGCIYEYDADHPIGGPGYTETDVPTFTGSHYSLTKVLLQELITGKCLLLRIRMPLTADLHPRNFITKIVGYAKVVNVPNSMTVLAELLPVAVDLISKGVVDTFNLVNPGAVDHNTILSLYQKYIDPSFIWVNFSLEEQSKILKAGRSNCCLDASKICRRYPEIRPISEALVTLFEEMRRNLPAK